MTTFLRDTGKSLLFNSYLACVAPGQTKRLANANAQRVSVLCYHRVNDDLKDNVTVAISQFDDQMGLIADRYRVVSIADIVAGNLDRTCDRPIVAVTFDDGYLDNYENAVPILQKHGLPAAFFVSTGIVGTDKGFEHDLSKIGRPLANMSWDQLRDIHAHGFEIGAHTVSHANLALIDEDEARRELEDSREKLRKEIGIETVSFAYCFGGRHDITPPRRDLVKALGYSCCFSAYGGTNIGEIDLFDIKRFGVNWAFSRAALRARIEGWA